MLRKIFKQLPLIRLQNNPPNYLFSSAENEKQ